MLRQLAIGSAFAVLAAGSAWAGEYGTPAEAKAMLEKAVAAVNADKAQALAMFTKGEGGFKDRDLYPYCGGPDGNFTAHPSLVGNGVGTELEGVFQMAGIGIFHGLVLVVGVLQKRVGLKNIASTPFYA